MLSGQGRFWGGASGKPAAWRPGLSASPHLYEAESTEPVPSPHPHLRAWAWASSRVPARTFRRGVGRPGGHPARAGGARERASALTAGSQGAARRLHAFLGPGKPAGRVGEARLGARGRRSGKPVPQACRRASAPAHSGRWRGRAQGIRYPPPFPGLASRGFPARQPAGRGRGEPGARRREGAGQAPQHPPGRRPPGGPRVPVQSQLPGGGASFARSPPPASASAFLCGARGARAGGRRAGWGGRRASPRAGRGGGSGRRKWRGARRVTPAPLPGVTAARASRGAPGPRLLRGRQRLRPGRRNWVLAFSPPRARGSISGVCFLGDPGPRPQVWRGTGPCLVWVSPRGLRSWRGWWRESGERFRISPQQRRWTHSYLGLAVRFGGLWGARHFPLS